MSWNHEKNPTSFCPKRRWQALLSLGVVATYTAVAATDAAAAPAPGSHMLLFSRRINFDDIITRQQNYREWWRNKYLNVMGSS